MFEQMKQYNYIGIRGINTNEVAPYEVGQTVSPSYAWDWETQQSSYYSEEPVEIGTCAIKAIDYNSIYWVNFPDSRDEEKETVMATLAERIAHAKSAYDYDRYYLIGSQDLDWNCPNDDQMEINMVNPVVIAEI